MSRSASDAVMRSPRSPSRVASSPSRSTSSRRCPRTRSPMAKLIAVPGELEFLHVLARQPNS